MRVKTVLNTKTNKTICAKTGKIAFDSYGAAETRLTELKELVVS